jgi:hypothetical protein
MKIFLHVCSLVLAVHHQPLPISTTQVAASILPRRENFHRRLVLLQLLSASSILPDDRLGRALLTALIEAYLLPVKPDTRSASREAHPCKLRPSPGPFLQGTGSGVHGFGEETSTEWEGAVNKPAILRHLDYNLLSTRCRFLLAHSITSRPTLSNFSPSLLPLSLFLTVTSILGFLRPVSESIHLPIIPFPLLLSVAHVPRLCQERCIRPAHANRHGICRD